MAYIALALVPLLLTGPAAALLYIALLKRGRRGWQWFFWPLLFAATVVVGATIAHTFSDFFPGPGCFATLFTPASAILTLVVFRRQSKRFNEAVGGDTARRRWFQSAMLIFAALQLSAPAIGFVYARTCNALDRYAAQPIIAALERYQEEHGRYPMLADRHRSDLGVLVPQYLDEIPPRACGWSFGQSDSDFVSDDWSLYFCKNRPDPKTLLLVPVLGSDAQQIYNPETGRWSRGNAFDGFCP